MALETLKGIEEIGGFEVDFWPEDRNLWKPTAPVIVNNKTNTIAFTIQNGPIKEVGVNGCQVDTLIEAAKLIVEGLNSKFPCIENEMTIHRLKEALIWSGERKRNREKRGVEGLDKV